MFSENLGQVWNYYIFNANYIKQMEDNTLWRVV
jgi:hypothetical protein